MFVKSTQQGPGYPEYHLRVGWHYQACELADRQKASDTWESSALLRRAHSFSGTSLFSPKTTGFQAAHLSS